MSRRQSRRSEAASAAGRTSGVQAGGLQLRPILSLTSFYNDNAEGLNLGRLAEDRAVELGRNVGVQAAYTWSHFRYLQSTSFYGDIDGQVMPHSPEHQLIADIDW